MKVSVVIITCNRPEYITHAISSVIAQSRKADEIIIVDDGSDKDYQGALSSFEQEKFIYHRFDTKQGANVARNKGVELASGDIIAFLDDDDVWKPEFIQLHLECYQQLAGTRPTSAVVSGYQIMGTKKLVINQQTMVTKEALRLGNLFCGMSGFSALSSVLREIPFDVNLTNGQDWDLYVRIVLANYQILNVPKALFEYRINSSQGISVYSKTMDISEAEKRLSSIIKHKSFLGDKYYKYRIANNLLAYIYLKTNRRQWLLKSCQLAGALITIHVLFSKLTRKIFR